MFYIALILGCVERAKLHIGYHQKKHLLYGSLFLNSTVVYSCIKRWGTRLDFP